MSRWLVAWGPAATWAAFLFFVSSQPTLPVDLASGLDKVAHFCAYLVLGFLCTFATRRTSVSSLAAVGFGWLYGAADEFHQSLVPGRNPALGDWFADATGTVAGVMLFLLLFPNPRSSDDTAGAEPTR